MKEAGTFQSGDIKFTVIDGGPEKGYFVKGNKYKVPTLGSIVFGDTTLLIGDMSEELRGDDALFPLTVEKKDAKNGK